jgi:hypothetical protein
MPYLQASDYTLIISQDNLDEILTQAAFTSGLSNAVILSNAQSWAQERVKQILAPKYQIATEFSKNAPDATRLWIVMNWVITLSVWKLHMTVAPRDIPETRQAEYDMAMSEMKESLRGESPVYGLPIVSGSVSSAFVSSGAKFVSNEFKDANQWDAVRDSPIPGANFNNY